MAEEHDLRVQAGVALWTSLGATTVLPPDPAFTALLHDNARFALSIVNQYQNKGISQEELIAAAFNGFFLLYRQHQTQPHKIKKLLALFIRNAILEKSN